MLPTTLTVDKNAAKIHNQITLIVLSSKLLLEYIQQQQYLFNGPLSGSTQVSQYQKGKISLDFTEARDSQYQWHHLGHMQICTSPRQITMPAPSLNFLQALPATF